MLHYASSSIRKEDGFIIMINIAIIGKRGSGKTTFLLRALAPNKLQYILDGVEDCELVVENTDLRNSIIKRAKDLDKGVCPPSTEGANEYACSLQAEDGEVGRVRFWELGGNTPLALSDPSFENAIHAQFAEMAGGLRGVRFDGYVIMDEAKNFGCIDVISHNAFSKRFSECLAFAEQTSKKPTLMLCSKKSSEEVEQGLYVRFRDNYRLRLGANYTFFDLEEKGKTSALKARYILMRFVAKVAHAKRDEMASCAENYSRCIKENLRIQKESDYE